MNRPLIIDSHDWFKTGLHSETKHRSDSDSSAVALYGIFSLAKLNKNTILRLKYNNINFLFTELLYKITFALVIFGQKQHSCDIALAAGVISLIT